MGVPEKPQEMSQLLVDQEHALPKLNVNKQPARGMVLSLGKKGPFHDLLEQFGCVFLRAPHVFSLGTPEHKHGLGRFWPLDQLWSFTSRIPETRAYNEEACTEGKGYDSKS